LARFADAQQNEVLPHTLDRARDEPLHLLAFARLFTLAYDYQVQTPPTIAPADVRWRARLFAAAVFLGAFLLFQIQPLLAKLILPWFGGAASVWTASMLFFQVALVCGYFYAY